MGRRGEVAALPKGYSEGRGVFSQRFRGRRERNTERSSHLIFDTRPNCGSRGGSSGESVSSAAALTGPRLPEHQPLRPAPAPVEVVPKTLLGSAGNGNGADGSASEAGASSSGSGGGEGGVAGGGGPQHPGPIANASEAGVTPGDVVVRLKRVSLTFRKVKDGSND